MSETPIYDGLVAERLGRGPAEFEGHDLWDESDEARDAYARGVAAAEATAAEFWERDRTPPRRRGGLTSQEGRSRSEPPGRRGDRRRESDSPPRDRSLEPSDTR